MTCVEKITFAEFLFFSLHLRRETTLVVAAQIPAVSSKEGAVIGAVLSTRKFHRGHH
jgi:hypothetical protein